MVRVRPEPADLALGALDVRVPAIRQVVAVTVGEFPLVHLLHQVIDELHVRRRNEESLFGPAFIGRGLALREQLFRRQEPPAAAQVVTADVDREELDAPRLSGPREDEVNGGPLMRDPLHEMDPVLARKAGDQLRHAGERLLVDDDVHVARDDVRKFPRVAHHAIGHTAPREEAEQ